jgi:hypothetical protein
MQQKDLKASLVASPVDLYISYRDRLVKYGQMASFPEFGHTVDFLLQEMDTERVRQAITNNPSLKLEYMEVKNYLFHCNLEFKVQEEVSYPYEAPYAGPYPYRPTLEAIEQAIRLFDKVERLDATSNAVKLYHFDRYCYHKHQLISDSNTVLLPFVVDLSFEDFIRTRSVPLNFVGVVSKTLRVDGHNQSPLDFWYHDLNHARRLYAYTKLKMKQNDATGVNNDAYFRETDDFIQKVILPNFVNHTPDMSEVDRELRKMCSLIIFEIVHETALTLDRESIINDLLRPNGPQPFEVMGGLSLGDVEELRTPTGNLQSGASLNTFDSSTPTPINYFLDKTSIGLLANVYSKLNHNYYDSSDMISDSVVMSEYRTPEFILSAVRHILGVLQYEKDLHDDYIIGLILNRDGIKERILHTPLNKNSVFVTQEATDPLKAGEIVELILARGKKVFTLFGYSALGYKDPASMLDAIRSDLEGLNTEEFSVCIGATEEGIGAAYEVAKEMGFETIGIVSTLALAYSGKFSDHVDAIYIVNDDLWGGYVPGTMNIAETTKAFLGVSSVISAYGGGNNTEVTCTIAKDMGIRVMRKKFEKA